MLVGGYKWVTRNNAQQGSGRNPYLPSILVPFSQYGIIFNLYCAMHHCSSFGGFNCYKLYCPPLCRPHINNGDKISVLHHDFLHDVSVSKTIVRKTILLKVKVR